MDKYEYKLKAEEIKALIGEGRYAEAVQIADTIDWNKVKSVRMLCTISDLYKINRRYEESREILVIASRFYPDGRYIIYSLCELSIKLQDIVPALEYYKEFVRIAPQNTSRYILKYKLFVAQDVSLEERIAVLQEFKKHDYREKWGYELAFLYHRVGLTTECVEECDELFLWFGGGRFVMKALELKALHEPLSPEQKKVYDRYKSGTQGAAPAPETPAYDSDRDEMGHDEKPAEEDGEFHVKTFDVGQNNTINLQQVIAESLKELSGKPADGRKASQETKVMEEVARRIAPKEPVPVDNTADTGVLGITDEDIEAYEEADTGRIGKTEETPDRSQTDSAADQPSSAGEGSASPQVLDSLRKTAQSIATDDTIWMPGIPEMARYAQEAAAQKDGPDSADVTGEDQPAEDMSAGSDEADFASDAIPQEISDTTIAQATGELPMPAPAEQVKPVVEEDPVKKALEKPGGMVELSAAGKQAEVPQKEGAPVIPVPVMPAGPERSVVEATAEQQLVEALQAEVSQGADELRRLRAAERRAELKSREKSGGMREVSSDTRRMGQTRKYVPVAARMDEAVAAALSDGKDAAEGRVLKPVAAADETASAKDGAGRGRVSQVVRPTRRDGNGYDNLLAESADGQLSMAVDERSGLERQITGQLSIQEFLTGWESYKEDQQRRQESGIKAHVKRDTDELFREYDEQTRNDLLHQLQTAQEEAIQTEAQGEDTGLSDAESGNDTTDLEEPAVAQTPEDEAAEDTVKTPEASAAGEETGRKPTPEEIAHQLAVLEGRIPPDAPAKAVTSEADEQTLKNAEGEAAQPLADADAVADAMQQPGDLTEEPEGEAADRDEQEADLPDDEGSGESDSQDEQTEPDAGEEGQQAESADGEDEHVLRVMTPEEKELFGPYIHRKRSRRQIINAIDSISMAAYTGNVILTGEEGAGTINLAKGLIRSVQLSDANFSGQIAKISGRAMNRKRVEAIVEKLAGGALIVQGAGGMNNETTKILLKSLQSENTGIVVVLEDTRKDMEKYLKKHPELLEVFNVRVDVEALATKELVSYAKQYALDKEFSMDEFAVLALHKRIDEMQTAEHEVTIAEVRAIVEEAIRRAIRKNPSHFFDILLQKRYDEEDMIILREKDFLR